ncbi:cellulase family glycosylhydrolase [Archangium sp.]|uniref:glycoside hydrolase family 5 protein n=1 Tax=Archangium sp. TaxID=1872627 RepID=UPI00286AC92C|nr:cellulase family glycosylhydrolase [Archangium sp.]
MRSPPLPSLAVASLLALAVASCAPTPWEPTGGDFTPPAEPGPFIHQDGTRLVDGTGAPIVLTGVNLGGWLVWEGWIWGGGWQSQKDMVARLQRLLGPEEAARFVQRVQEEFIREEDIAELARLGFNSVRVPFNHTLLEDDATPFVYKDEGWAVLDRLLEWCEAHRIYVVLDLHAAPGGQSPFYMADPDSTKLWDSTQNQERTVALWRAIAERYRDRQIIAGYDLLNEPSPPNGEALFLLYKRVAAAIREVDPHHLIILEGTSASSDFSMFTRPVTFNQAYSFHMYTWFGDPRREELAKYRALSERHGVPMWNGEFGENSLEMLRSTAEMYVDPANALAGFSFWTWKKVPNNSAHLVGVTADIPQWTKLIKWVESDWNARPTVEEARAGMDQFFEAARLENCDVNAELVSALRVR